MRRRNAMAMLLVASLLACGTVVQPLPQDQGVLLLVAGRPVDAAGRLLGAWTRLTRQCGAVATLAPDAPGWQAVQRSLADYSPPASARAWPVQVLVQGEWALAEVRWDGPPGADGPGAPGGAINYARSSTLDPAIVPLRQSTGSGPWQVQAQGVWSGDTGPWAAPVLIRRYLAERLPALPAALRQCLDPRLAPFAA